MMKMIAVALVLILNVPIQVEAAGKKSASQSLVEHLCVDHKLCAEQPVEDHPELCRLCEEGAKIDKKFCDACPTPQERQQQLLDQACLDCTVTNTPACAAIEELCP